MDHDGPQNSEKEKRSGGPKRQESESLRTGNLPQSRQEGKKEIPKRGGQEKKKRGIQDSEVSNSSDTNPPKPFEKN